MDLYLEMKGSNPKNLDDDHKNRIFCRHLEDLEEQEKDYKYKKNQIVKIKTFALVT